MPSLTETLRLQHREIEDRVGTVQAALDSGDAQAVVRCLRGLRTALTSHFQLENSRLYPELSEASDASRLEIPGEIASTYAQNMRAVTVALTAFMERYAALPLEMDAFRRDWPLVVRMLNDRIHSEESSLYPLYESWVMAQPPSPEERHSR